MDKRRMRERFPLSAQSRWILTLVVAVVLGTIACSTLVAREPQPPRFCHVCGAQQIQTSWAVRGTSVRLGTRQYVTATPISELLTTTHLISPHDHRWVAAAFVPDPLDQFGPPVIQSLGFINAPRVVSFMRDLARYGDRTSVATWQAQVLDPRYSYVIDGALRFLLAPEAGFESRDEFLRWWNTNAFALQTRLRELTEPD